jgi:hypothetical protein
MPWPIIFFLWRPESDWKFRNYALATIISFSRKFNFFWGRLQKKLFGYISVFVNFIIFLQSKIILLSILERIVVSERAPWELTTYFYKSFYGSSRWTVFTLSMNVSGLQHMYTMRKLYNKMTKLQSGCFLRGQETMNDTEQDPRKRMVGLQIVCLEIQSVSRWWNIQASLSWGRLDCGSRETFA